MSTPYDAIAQGDSVATVAPADVDLARGATVGLFVGGAGDLSVVSSDGSVAVFKNVPAKKRFGFSVIRVKAATTATNIVALYQV